MWEKQKLAHVAIRTEIIKKLPTEEWEGEGQVYWCWSLFVASYYFLSFSKNLSPSAWLPLRDCWWRRSEIWITYVRVKSISIIPLIIEVINKFRFFSILHFLFPRLYIPCGLLYPAREDVTVIGSSGWEFPRWSFLGDTEEEEEEEENKTKEKIVELPFLQHS